MFWPGQSSIRQSTNILAHNVHGHSFPECIPLQPAQVTRPALFKGWFFMKELWMQDQVLDIVRIADVSIKPFFCIKTLRYTVL